MFGATLEGLVLHWKVWCYTGLHWTTLDYTGLHWKVWCYTGLHWTTLEGLVLHWTTLEGLVLQKIGPLFSLLATMDRFHPDR